jgi:hypothetical protein
MVRLVPGPGLGDHLPSQAWRDRGLAAFDQGGLVEHGLPRDWTAT